MRANSLRFGPDGLLWIADTGTPKREAPPITDGPKLLAIDISKNQVVKTIALGKPVKRKSFVDDLRFHGDMIYVTDAGAPGLILLSQKTGQSSTLVRSPNLVWVDARWINHAGNLWLPVPQMNRTAGFQKGIETVKFPVRLYKRPISAKPFRD